MSTDKAYARCSGCNRSFFPAWLKEHKEFESLCWSCKKVAQHTARVDPILYGTGQEKVVINPDKWEQSMAEETNQYLGSIWDDRDIIEDSLYEQDEYLQGTGAESGEWFGVHNPFDTYEVTQ